MAKDGKFANANAVDG
ncbi:hypothetical protein [Borreliella burgdorferi]